MNWTCYGRELLAVDGTRIKAVNNRDRNFTRAKLKSQLQRTCERLDRYLDQMNQADAHDAGGSAVAVPDLQDKIASLRKRKETLEAHRQTLDDSGEAQLSLTDPDSRSMHTVTRVGVGYNVQIAVDTKHNLIAEQQVPQPGPRTSVCSRRRLRRPVRTWLSARSMRSPTEATTRSKTLRPAKPPGSHPTLRSLTGARSRTAAILRSLGLNTTLPRTLTGAPLVSA